MIILLVLFCSIVYYMHYMYVFIAQWTITFSIYLTIPILL